MKVTQKRLKDLLIYTLHTGVFTWISCLSGSVKDGAIAGHLDRNGYIRIRIDGKAYLAHRLAWLYHYGEWPTKIINHINGTKTDNRINNLEDTTYRGNNSNTKKHREGHLLGTTFNKTVGKFSSRIRIGKTSNHLGYFKTRQEASDVYQNALTFLKEVGIL